jgi:hypothetical protein
MAKPDAIAYCTSAEPIARDVLIQAGNARGWVLVPTHDLFEPDKFGVLRGGTLETGEYWYGWHKADTHAAQYDDALRAGNSEQLEYWAQADVDRGLGAAEVYFAPFSLEDRGDYSEDLLEAMGAAYVDALRCATVEYTTVCHSADNFYVLLARLIHQLRGGIWEDPVMGEWGADPDVGWEEWASPPCRRGPDPPTVQVRRWWQFWDARN